MRIPSPVDSSEVKSAITLRVKDSPLGGGRGGGSSSFSNKRLFTTSQLFVITSLLSTFCKDVDSVCKVQ